MPVPASAVCAAPKGRSFDLPHLQRVWSPHALDSACSNVTVVDFRASLLHIHLCLAGHVASSSVPEASVLGALFPKTDR